MTEQHLSAHARLRPSRSSLGVAHVDESHDQQFTVVGNHLAQHAELSLTAIGLAVHIQSLPTGSLVGIKALAAKFPEGETRVASALRELETHGYLSRTKERLPSGPRTTSPRRVRPVQPPHLAANRPQTSRSRNNRLRPHRRPSRPHPCPSRTHSTCPPTARPATSSRVSASATPASISPSTMCAASRLL